MDEKISFKDPNGKHLSGLFNVSGGMITVTAPDGRTKTAGFPVERGSARVVVEDMQKRCFAAL